MKIMIKRIRPFLMLGVLSVHAASVIKMNKAFYHKGTMSDKIVFYFSKDPVCMYVPQQTDTLAVNEQGFSKIELLFPFTELANSEVKSFISQMNVTAQDNPYRVYLASNDMHNGLACTVSFKPQDVGLQYEIFEAITGEKGVVFTFFKRRMAEELNNNCFPVRRVGYLKKKE